MQAEGDKLLIVSEFPGKVIGEAASYLVASADGLYQFALVGAEVVGIEHELDKDDTPVKDGLTWVGTRIGSDIEEAKQYLISLSPDQKNLIESSFGATGTAVDWTVAAGAAKLASKGVTAAKGGTQWTYGTFKSNTKWANQLAQRGWTEKQITEAIIKGKSFDAVNMVNKTNGATRYVHPTTGQSIVVDNVTKELLHTGGAGFKY